MPVYNSQEFVLYSLQSIANSSYRNLEVIIVDDCSTDNTKQIITDFIKTDDRFLYFHNTSNRQVSMSRNNALRKVTGDYITFVDSDDYISEDWIESLVQTATTKDAHIVIGKTKQVTDGVETDYNMRTLDEPKELHFKTIMLNKNAVVWNKLYRTELILNNHIYFAPDIYIGEDLLFNYKAMFYALKIYYNDKGYYYYRKDNETSIMNKSQADTYCLKIQKVLNSIINFNNLVGDKNIKVMKKQVRDILLQYYLADRQCKIDMAELRNVDFIAPEKVKLHLLRKRLFRKNK
jgi:glycosyltransferase involved in cell wall biosynthesis